jgi:ribosome-associated protein
VEDKLRVSGSCVIGLDELEWRFSASGGPGGQHANKASTRVEVRFDVEGSPSLGPRQRERLLEKLGPTVRIVADDERSQLRNRTVALERLRAKLVEGLHQDPPRHKTAPTKSAEQRRLDAKRRRSTAKRDRAWRPDNE